MTFAAMLAAIAPCAAQTQACPTGQHCFTVPNVVGLPAGPANVAGTAEFEISQVAPTFAFGLPFGFGLPYSTVTTPSQVMPAGDVIATFPAAGAAQVDGVPVTLQVSSGPINTLIGETTTSPIIFTNGEGTTTDSMEGNCAGCVTFNGQGHYDLYISIFNSGPAFLPPPGGGTEYYGGDCHITISSGGTFVAGGACTYQITATPGMNYAVFAIVLAADGTPAGAAFVFGGVTTAPVVDTIYGCLPNGSPPPGAVVCNPNYPGSSYTSFSSITIDWAGIIASSPPPAPPAGSVIVPDVLGLTPSSAIAVIGSQTLVEGTVSSEPSDVYPVGSIISQTPAPFLSAPTGSAVNVVVATAPVAPPLVSDVIPNFAYRTAVNTNSADRSLYAAVSKGNYTQGGPLNDIVVYSTVDDTVVANIVNSVGSAYSSTLATATVEFMAVDTVNNFIYASNSNGTVTVIDGLTHTIDTVLTVGVSPLGIAVDPGLNKAYVANSDDTKISVIQGPVRTAGVITTHAQVAASIGGILPQGAIAVDVGTHAVYAIIDGPAALGEANYTLAVINGETNAITTTVSYLDNAGFTNIAADALGVDQKSHKVVIADAEDQAVHIYNPNGGGLQSYFENFYPNDVVVDSTSENAYVSTGHGNIVQINLLSGAQTTVANASGAPCGYAGTAVAVDSAMNVAYFTACDGTVALGRDGIGLFAWNGASSAPIGALGLGSPLGSYGSFSGTLSLTVNPLTHVAYVSDSDYNIAATAGTVASTGAIVVINGPTPGPSPVLTLSSVSAPVAGVIFPQPLDAPFVFAFGGIPDGTDSSAVEFNVVNNSPVNATIQSPLILGSGFATTGGSCFASIPTFANGGFCEATMDFQPTTSLSYQGGFAFLDNQRDTPHLFGLTGRGTGTVALTIDPSTLPLAYVGLGYPPGGGLPVTFSSPNAIGGGSFNICKTLASGAPDTSNCCSSNPYDLGPGSGCPAGVLPPGMNWAYGNLNGSPTATGSYPFSVIASDSNGDTGSQAYSLIVDGPFTTALALSPNPVTGGASVTARVTLNQGAPAGGAYVFIDSGTTAVVPSTLVEFTAGQTQAVATVTTNTVASPTVVDVFPYYSTAGNTVALTVNPAGAPTTTTVPNVVGLTQAGASTAITAASLVVGTVTTASSSAIASGEVISQLPVSGTSEKDGTGVNLVISTGPVTTTVPSVVGLSKAAAGAAITSASLVLGTVTTAPNSTIAAGDVISQSPVGGVFVANGTLVNLVISTGPVTTAVPSVVGLSKAAATAAIATASLALGTVTTAPSSTIGVGDVISQSPVGGVFVAHGTGVNLVISTGPVTTAVPSVIGLSKAAATAAITSASLILGTVTTATSSTIAAGDVISQSPVGGVFEPDGTAVNLVISSGPPSVTVPNEVGASQPAATNALAALTLVTAVTTSSSTTFPLGNVISQSPAAGTLVSDGATVNLVISSGPPTVTVPNEVGQTQAAAINALTALTLVPAITASANSTVPSGNVISQTPVATTIVGDGATVNLVISTGLAATPTISITLAGTPVFAGGASQPWSVTVELLNSGNETASIVSEVAATLNGVAPSVAVSPITNLAPGATGTLVLTFPATAGATGGVARIAVNGNYSGTALSGTWNFSIGRGLTLP